MGTGERRIGRRERGTYRMMRSKEAVRMEKSG